MAKYPKVNLHVEYYDAAIIYDGIMKGDIDIGVVAAAKMHRNIDVYPFENEPLVFVCSPQHRLAGESVVDIHQLQMEEFIAFEKGVPTRLLIDDILRQYNVTVHTAMEFDNVETIKRAVEIGAGVSMLPETAIQTELSNGDLRAAEFSNDRFVRPTSVIVRKDKTFTHAGRYLIELLSHSN